MDYLLSGASEESPFNQSGDDSKKMNVIAVKPPVSSQGFARRQKVVATAYFGAKYNIS
jgi:hypothetical protein